MSQELSQLSQQSRLVLAAQALRDRSIQHDVAPSGLVYNINNNKPKLAITARLIQRKACDIALEALGDRAWLYSNNKGHECRELKSIFQQLVHPKVGCQDLQYNAFWRWLLCPTTSKYSSFIQADSFTKRTWTTCN